MESNNTTKNNILECLICLSSAEDPIVTQCGHIFCWGCIKNWIQTSNQMFCPICKNGINLDKVIPLYENTTNKHQDKPKVGKIHAENRNKPGFIKTIFNAFLYASENDDIVQYSDNEVKANRIALVFLLITIIIVYSIIFY